MPVDRILISAQPFEVRIALMDAERLAALEVWRPGGTSVVGNVYLGRVESVHRGLQAAFVDIGLERSGFLALAEARPADRQDPEARDGISDYVEEGMETLVQVTRDALPGKGVKLTTRITLPGRYLVLQPEGAGVAYARRITERGLRERLEDMVEPLLADDGRIIVRSAAVDAGPDDLARDLDRLSAAWDEIIEREDGARPPACLMTEVAPVLKVLRDGELGAVERIAVDDWETFKRMRSFAERVSPSLVDRLVHDTGAGDLFEREGVEEQIDDALLPVVPLSGGGDIVIDETQALVVVDVNTGRARDGARFEDVALATNEEAAFELGRQARLRNLAGLIVVDFVSMRRRANRERVLDALQDALRGDPVNAYVAGFTRMGLVEMTRERRRPSLLETLTEPSPVGIGLGRIKSAETVAYEALRRVLAEGRARPGARIRLRAPGRVVAFLEDAGGGALDAVADRLGRPPELAGDGSLAADGFDVVATGAGDGG